MDWTCNHLELLNSTLPLVVHHTRGLGISDLSLKDSADVGSIMEHIGAPAPVRAVVDTLRECEAGDGILGAFGVMV